MNTYADLQFQGLRRLHLWKLDPTLFLRQLYQLSCARRSKPLFNTMLAHSVFCPGLVYFDLQMEWGMLSLRYLYTLELFSRSLF